MPCRIATVAQSDHAATAAGRITAASIPTAIKLRAKAQNSEASANCSELFRTSRHFTAAAAQRNTGSTGNNPRIKSSQP
jgi:hypothetical protein